MWAFVMQKKKIRCLWRQICLGVLLARRSVKPPPPDPLPPFQCIPAPPCRHTPTAAHCLDPTAGPW